LSIDPLLKLMVLDKPDQTVGAPVVLTDQPFN